MPKAPTIIDVATLAGVSKSLVSMVMRDDPGVSDARRAAVLDAAASLGYRPNRAAAILAGTRTRTIGVVIEDFRNPWYIPMLDGIRSVLSAHGLRLTVVDTTSNAHLPTTPFDDLVSLRVDGVVIAAESAPDLVIPPDLPVVVAGVRAVAPDGVDTVAADEDAGGRLATDHLLDLGHRSVAYLNGTGGSAVVRRAAYESRMVASGSVPIVVGDGPTTERTGYLAAAAVLADHPEVTALFAANDVMAMGAIAAAHEAGRTVPGDLSVLGFDDSPLASSPLLRLTTVDPRSTDVGRVAATRLVELIDGTGERGAAVTTLLEPSLVVRATTAAPSG
jgi:DNA-binding LacI/PurR family transcriptional regulator